LVKKAEEILGVNVVFAPQYKVSAYKARPNKAPCKEPNHILLMKSRKCKFWNSLDYLHFMIQGVKINK
jgi:hypothetical protein